MTLLVRCGFCGTPFPVGTRTVYCSDRCKNRGTHRDYCRRQAQARQALLPRTCKQCGGPIEGAQRATRRYCSDVCRYANRNTHTGQGGRPDAVDAAVRRDVGSRDTRTVCPTCAVEKDLFMRWDNARGCQVVWESCRCGTVPQRPDVAGPRLRRYDQGAARLAQIAKEVGTASRRSQGKYAHGNGKMRSDFRNEDAA